MPFFVQGLTQNTKHTYKILHTTFVPFKSTMERFKIFNSRVHAISGKAHAVQTQVHIILLMCAPQVSQRGGFFLAMPCVCLSAGGAFQIYQVRSED